MARAPGLGNLAHTAGGAGAATTEGRRVGVGVTTGMQHQSPTQQVVCDQSRRHHVGDGAAIRLDDKPAEITPMALSKGPLMGAGCIGVPVSTRFQTGDGHTFRVETGIATAVAVQMEAVFAWLETLQLRADDQTLVGVGCCDRADTLADAIGIDPMQLDINRTGPGHWCDQKAQGQKNRKQKTLHKTRMAQASLTPATTLRESI